MKTRMIEAVARKSFSRFRGPGTHKRGELARIPHRLMGDYVRGGLVVWNFTEIPGVTFDHCLKLASDGCLTFEHLRELDPIPGYCAEFVEAWRSGNDAPVIPESVAEPTDFDLTSIDGVGAPTRDKLTESGYGTREALLAATDEQIRDTGISNISLGKIRVWREAQVSDG